MASKRLIQTDSFSCEDDTGGQFIIVELTAMHDTTAMGDSTKNEMPGLKQYRTSQGDHVNRKDDGTFEIVETGTIVWPTP